MTGPDPAILAGAVDEAVDALLAIRVMVAAIDDIEPPDDALDLALQADLGHQVARRAFDDILERVRHVLGSEGFALVLELEEHVNELASRATDVGYRVGVGVRTGRLPRLA